MKIQERENNYLFCIGAIVFGVIFLAACTKNVSVDAGDIAVLSDACKALSKKEAKDACYVSLAKIAGDAVKNIKIEPELGIAKEEIAFKGVPLDKPDRMEDLMAICRQVKDNLESVSSGYKKESQCRASDGRTWFQVGYGSLEKAYLHFKLGDAGELLNVWGSLKNYEVQPLVTVLSEKYGPPKIQEEEVRNGLGNTFNKQVITWIDHNGNIILINSIYDKVDEGRFEIQSASYLKGNVDKAMQKINAGKERL